jgi:hypothetical protein
MMRARLVCSRRWWMHLAAAATVWLCVALLADCGGPGGARPAVTGTGGSGVTSGAWRADTSGTQQRLYAVACLSALRCEAVGAAGTIVATGNGGATWRAQANPLQGSSKILYRIACVAPSTCYVIARPDTILVTHDGGGSWSSHVLPTAGAGASLASQGCLAGTAADIRGRPALCRLGLLDIACVSARICSAVANGPAGYYYGPIPTPSWAGSSSAIWMTSDGGTSWARQSVPPGVGCTEGDCGTLLFNYPLEWISCLSSGLCRAGGGHFGGCGSCGDVYAVVAVTRPGAPWTMLTCPQPPYPCSRTINSSARGSPFAPDAGVCPTAARCYGVFSTNPFDPGNGVDWSTDGGALWAFGPSGASSIRNAIACPAARICYTAGDQGTITRTVNGTAFVADGRPTSRDLYGITCANAAICYAVGDNGTIVARQ